MSDGIEEQAINVALSLLRAHGYHVTRPDLRAEMTMKDLGKQTGLKPATLHKRLHCATCPPWSATLCGPSGRVLRLRASAEAIAWLKTPLQPGRKL